MFFSFGVIIGGAQGFIFGWGSHLVRLRGPYVVLRIEPWWAVSKAITLPATFSVQSLLKINLYEFSGYTRYLLKYEMIIEYGRLLF